PPPSAAQMLIRPLPATRSPADQGQVNEPLRKVAEERAGSRIDFLGVEADVVRERYQVVQEPFGLAAPARDRERLGKPERAADERAFALEQAVVARVPAKEGAGGELAPNGLDRHADTRRVGTVVARDGEQQQARVELVRIGVP